MATIFKTSSSFLSSLFSSKKRLNEQQYTYNPLAIYRHLSSYHSCMDAVPTRSKIETENAISYSGIIPFGSTIREVKKKLGEYTFKTRYSGDQLPRTILLFKRKISGQNVKIEMHFYKNRLFFFNTTYSYANAQDRNRLNDMLVEKYNVESNNLQHDAIFDQNQNCVMVTEGADYSIKYFETSNPFFSKLNDIRYAEYEELSNQKDIAMNNLLASL